ncbi:MAG: GntR family transcriptional regulator [Thermodesulfobacteriota bacterium]
MSRKQQVYEYLLEAILSNKLPPGSPIIETEIATALSTSRTPVREALKELEKDGLVTQYSQKGTFVSEITPHDVEEIFNLRIMFEVSALQLAYDKINEEELNKIESMFSLLDAGSSSAGDFAIADKSLHSLIVDKAGNYRLKQFLSILNAQIERFRRIAAMEPTRLTNSKKEHLEIVAKLRQKDLNACETSLRNHLNNVKKSTLEIAKLLLMERTSGKFNKSHKNR